MKDHLIEHHHAMAKAYRDHAESMDDGHEHKAFFHKLGKHHHDLAKALELGPDVMPTVGSEGRRGGNDLMPTKARRVFERAAPAENLRLIQRAGGPPVDAARVSDEMEDALGNI